jgi:HSP20 family protein
MGNRTQRRDVFNEMVKKRFLFYSPFSDGENVSMRDWLPVVDIYDNDDTIVIKTEPPGVDKKNIKVDVNGRILTLKGERSTDNEVKEDDYYRRERSFGKFERSFTLPADIDPDKIKADFKDGVLKLNIPKPEAHKPKQISVH